MNAYNYRRLGPLRDVSAVGDASGREDDKNRKADSSSDRTTKFIVILFILSCVVCLALILNHIGRDDIVLPQDRHTSTIAHSSALPPVSAQAAAETLLKLNSIMNNNMNPIENKETAGYVNPSNVQESSVKTTTIEASQVKVAKKGVTEQQNAEGKAHFAVIPVEAPKTPPQHPSTPAMDKPATKQVIDWSGCLYELPDPNPKPEDKENSAVAGKGKKKSSAVGYDYNRKHIVPPPAGAVTLVCCNTTKGALNIEVHPTWAPIGAERFLHMVNSGFFSTGVGLFRALRFFLVQFGLPGDPAVLQAYHQMGNLKDDPSWLPLGPPGREINGTRRFQKGYLAYAGAGKNSRGTQLIMAFESNLYLGGGSPWEVPWGQVFGANSFETLGKIYTGYGEKPSQGKIMNRGNAYLKQEFPLLDYITKCAVTRENVPWRYVPT